MSHRKKRSETFPNRNRRSHRQREERYTHPTNFYTLRHDQYTSPNHYDSTCNHRTYGPNHPTRRWRWRWRWRWRRRWWRWRRRRRNPRRRRWSPSRATCSHRKVGRQSTQRIPRRQGGEQIFSPQLPPVPGNEPTCGTAGHPISKKYDISVVHQRTPRKRLGRRTSTVAYRSNHRRSTPRRRESVAYYRDKIPPSIHGFGAKTPTRIHLLQRKGQRERPKRRSNKTAMEKRAQQSQPKRHGHRTNQGTRHIHGRRKTTKGSKWTLLPLQPKRTYRQILSKPSSKSRGSIHEQCTHHHRPDPRTR